MKKSAVPADDGNITRKKIAKLCLQEKSFLRRLDAEISGGGGGGEQQGGEESVSGDVYVPSSPLATLMATIFTPLHLA